MIAINKNTLDMELVQGDTGTFSFSLLNKNTGESLLKDGDSIWFTLKKLVDKSVIIQKEIREFPDGIVTVPLTPEETSDIEKGNYIYDLKLIRKDGNVDTLNPNRPYSNFSVKKGAK